MLVVNGATAAPEFVAYTDTFMSDGLVLARNVGYEDWVRRAAAIDAMAIPPISPISRTKLRYPPQLRPKEARKRYQATARI